MSNVARRRLAVLVVAALCAGISPGFASESHAVTFAIEFVDNVEEDFGTRGWLEPTSLFQRNIAAAAAEWGSRLTSNEVMMLRVRADRSLARTGGTFSNGLTIGMIGQRDLVEPGPLSLTRTGKNPGTAFFGFDIVVGINAQFVDDFYWIDPQPEQRTTPVQSDRGDFISIIMHELGHGLGMAGVRSFVFDASYGGLPADFLLLFDSMSSFGGDGFVEDSKGDPNPMSFTGVTSSAIFGGPVPLSNVGRFDFLFSQNFYHLGTCFDPAILTGSLMNGCSIPNGVRLPISDLDLAVYADLGYETVPEPGATCAIATALASLGVMRRASNSARERKVASLMRRCVVAG